MPNQPRDQPEQELSIKERSHQLFVSEPSAEDLVRAKPFEIHLRETAAQPLSTLTKAILWIAGIIVTVLFLAAVIKIVQRHNSAPRPTDKAAVPGSSVHLENVRAIAGIADAGLSAGDSKCEDKKFAIRFTG